MRNHAAMPGGARPVTTLPQVEQLARMETILTLCDTELAPHVQILHLEDWVERLREITTQYRDELERVDSITVTFAEVRDAELECQERLAQLMIRVGADFNDRTPEHAALRARLLAPIHEQDEALAAANRRSRRTVDINPDTGVEEDIVIVPEPEPAA